MNNTERMLYLSSQLMMLSIDKELNRKEIEQISEELTNLQLQMQKTAFYSAAEEIEQDSGFLKFSQTEILKMPKTFRKTFKAQGCTAHVRKRTEGRYKCSYEIRYAKRPYDKHPISASGTTLEEAKARFIEKLNNYVPLDDTIPTVPKDFDGFAMYWFVNFHKRKVKDVTYKGDIIVYNNHIKPKYEGMQLKKINAATLQKHLDSLSHIPKKKDDVHSLLNQIFNCAVKHGLITLNPLGMCFYKKRKKKHGEAISIEEEKRLLTSFDGTPYQLYYAVIIYTGLRPCEYHTAVLEGDFIRAVNSKRHDLDEGEVEYKYIPITPMLRPYLKGIENISIPRSRSLLKRFKKVLPNHKLYDMRTTFETRCDQCKIPDNVIGVIMGNSIGKSDKDNLGNELKKAYTDINDKDYMRYIYEECQKLKY